jgi:hypothetical protein
VWIAAPHLWVVFLRVREYHGVSVQRTLGRYTPKHASWLNMAEIEISVLTKQCLNRRLNAMERVASEASIWMRHRNRRRVSIHWTFRHADARRVFPELYRKRLAG